MSQQFPNLQQNKT